MSEWYPSIDEFYKEGFYTDADVRYFVSAGWISPAEYAQITGSPY